MIRLISILAAVLAVAVSAASASAGTSVGVKDGSSNTVQFGEFASSKTPPTRTAALILENTMISGYSSAPRSKGTGSSSGIIAVLIGL